MSRAVRLSVPLSDLLDSKMQVSAGPRCIKSQSSSRNWTFRVVIMYSPARCRFTSDDVIAMLRADCRWANLRRSAGDGPVRAFAVAEIVTWPLASISGVKGGRVGVHYVALGRWETVNALAPVQSCNYHRLAAAGVKAVIAVRSVRRLRPLASDTARCSPSAHAGLKTRVAALRRPNSAHRSGSKAVGCAGPPARRLRQTC